MKGTIKRSIRIALSPFVLPEYIRFKKYKDKRFLMRLIDIHPHVRDKTFTTNFDRHYVYFTSWAARRVKKKQPKEHVDISSSLYFAGIVSAFVPIKFYDYRPAALHLTDLEGSHADLTSLPFADNSIESLSSMHVIEHIGLGRYGDPLDAEGDIKASGELARVLAPGGQLLIVVPVGSVDRIEFNAHRIYTYERVRDLFPTLQLAEFSYVPEKGPRGIQEHADPLDLKKENYACGLFVFTKSA